MTLVEETEVEGGVGGGDGSNLVEVVDGSGGGRNWWRMRWK